jgi:IMP dehydrogenase/GMP reductase
VRTGIPGHNRILKDPEKNFKHLNIIAGNIATAEGAEALADAGADAIKVGIGPVLSALRGLLPVPVCRN